MKRLLLTALRRSGWIRFGLFVVFLVIMDFPGFMVNFFTFTGEPSVTREDANYATYEFRKLEKSILDGARSLGANYTPDDYFNDLYTLTSSPHFKRAAFSFSGIDELMMNIRNNYSLKEIGAAADRARDKLPVYNSEESARKLDELFGQYDWDWLVTRYFACMPLALILFLLWLSAGADDGKRFWPSLWRFALTLIGYPVVIGITWWSQLRSKGRGWLAEAALRQRKEYLTESLSEKEKGEIHIFSRGRESFVSWRKRLNQNNQMPRHSFVAAMLVVLIFSLGIRVSVVNAFAFEKSSQISIEQGETHLPRDKIEKSNDEGHCSVVWGLVIFLSELDFSLPLVSWVKIYLRRLVSLDSDPPEHIPCLTVWFLDVADLIKTKRSEKRLSDKERMGNEKVTKLCRSLLVCSVWL